MIPHPLLLATLVTDVTALALVVAASVTAGRVVLSFRPEAADRGQLALERRAEVASIQGRIASALLWLGTVLLVVAVASVLPGVVPGAMCGTGVVQAMAPVGARALVLRGLALLGLGVFGHLDALDRTRPDAPLTVAAARSMLLALPLVALAALDTFGAVLALDVQTPVDCCAVVFDAARARRSAAASAAGSAPLAPLAVAGAALLFVLGLGLWRSARARASAALRWALPPLVLAWVPLSAVALTRELAAYHYGVLAHDCPFCLFAARHHLLGYPLFGALAVATLEGAAVAVSHLAARGRPPLRGPASRRLSVAGLRLAAAVLLFAALAVGPALAYRLRHGLWIDS